MHRDGAAAGSRLPPKGDRHTEILANIPRPHSTEPPPVVLALGYRRRKARHRKSISGEYGFHPGEDTAGATHRGFQGGVQPADRAGRTWPRAAEWRW